MSRTTSLTFPPLLEIWQYLSLVVNLRSTVETRKFMSPIMMLVGWIYSILLLRYSLGKYFVSEKWHFLNHVQEEVWLEDNPRPLRWCQWKTRGSFLVGKCRACWRLGVKIGQKGEYVVLNWEVTPDRKIVKIGIDLSVYLLCKYSPQIQATNSWYSRAKRCIQLLSSRSPRTTGKLLNPIRRFCHRESWISTSHGINQWLCTSLNRWCQCDNVPRSHRRCSI